MSRYSGLFLNLDGSSTAKGDAGTDIETSQPGSFTLLFVDDEEHVISSLERIFWEESYTILTCTSPAKALEIMESRPVQLVISDYRMPGMTGSELLGRIKEKWPETIRIMLTGFADVNAIMGAVKEGAVYKFITKPWNDEDLRLTVSLALQQYLLAEENRKLKELSLKQQNRINDFKGMFGEDRGRLADILVNAGLLGREQLESARKKKTTGEFLGDTLVRLGLLSESAIVAALLNSQDISFIDLREISVPTDVARCLPRNLCEQRRLFPIRFDGDELTVAMADPSDTQLCNSIGNVTGFKVKALLASSSQISEKISHTSWDFENPGDLEPLNEIDIVLEEERESNVEALIGASNVPPVIRIVNAIISEAIRYGAGNIHIEAKTKNSLIRFRIDGVLYSKIEIPADIHQAVISRIKILARMDVSERRKPQNGRITVQTGLRIVDMQISSLPTINGENIVIGLRDRYAPVRHLSELGLQDQDYDRLQMLIRKPHGIIIASGPSDSGKSTLLYSILSSMITREKSFETIEEHAGFFLEEANQVSLDKSGITSAQMLLASMQQDPDVILLGEIADEETADAAFKAALAGRRILTSLHASSAASAIVRLLGMVGKPDIIAFSLDLVVAQRLVRKICDACRTPSHPEKRLLDLLQVPHDFLRNGVYRGTGCPLCNNSGYSGRIGLYELVFLDNDMRQMISCNYSESELLTKIRANGTRTLLEDGLQKVRDGITTLDELLQVATCFVTASGDVETRT